VWLCVQCDLDHMREVSFDEAVALVQQCDLRSLVETSAATGQGVLAAVQTALTGTFPLPPLLLSPEGSIGSRSALRHHRCTLLTSVVLCCVVCRCVSPAAVVGLSLCSR
jgi:hypothetical protein